MIVNQKREPMLANWGRNLVHYKRSLATVTLGRYITWLKAALAMHYKIPTATAAGDFAIEFYGTFSANGFYLTARGFDSRCLVTSTGVVYVGGANFNIPAELLPFMGDQNAHSLLFTRTAGVVKLHIDSALAGSASYTSEFVVELIGSRWTASTSVPHFEGALFHANFISGFTQIGNPAGNPHYRFDTNYLVDGNHSPVVKNVNAELGSELIVNGTFDDGLTGWLPSRSSALSVVDGNLRVVVQSQSSAGARQSFTTVVGTQYLLTLDSKNTTSGIHVTVGTTIDNNGNHGASYPANQLISILFTATDTTTLVTLVAYSITAGLYAEFDNTSVKEAPGCAEAINIKAINTEYYEEQADGSLLGEDRITQAIWESPDSAGNQWAFGNNQWSIVGDGNYNALTLLQGAARLPPNFRLSGNVSAISGTLATVAHDSSYNINSVGQYSFDVDGDISGGQQYKRGGGVVNATLDKPSLRQLIKRA